MNLKGLIELYYTIRCSYIYEMYETQIMNTHFYTNINDCYWDHNASLHTMNMYFTLWAPVIDKLTHTCIISLLIDDTSVYPVWPVCVLLFTVNKQLHKCFFLSPSQNLHYLMSTLRDFYLCLFVGGKSQLVGVVWLLKTGVGMLVALGSVVDLFLHTACHSNSNQSQLLQGSSEDQALRSSESCDCLLQERHVEVRQRYGGNCSPWWWRWCRKSWVVRGEIDDPLCSAFLSEVSSSSLVNSSVLLGQVLLSLEFPSGESFFVMFRQRTFSRSTLIECTLEMQILLQWSICCFEIHLRSYNLVYLNVLTGL